MPSKLWVEGSNPSSITNGKRDIKSLMSRFFVFGKNMDLDLFRRSLSTDHFLSTVV